MTGDRRRLLLAFGCAIAIHEIAIGALGFLRAPQQAAQAQTVPSAIVVIETRTPTPRATPTPAPIPHATPADVRTRAAPRAAVIAKHSGGSKGGPKLEVHTQRIVHHKEALPIWWTAPHGAKRVANTGTGTQPTPGPAAGNAQGSGTGTGAGTATGAGGGAGGNGGDVASADAPCGTPLFYGLHAEFNPRDGSFAERVRVQLTLGDGETLEGDFHYPWRYPNEAQNPFSPKTEIPPDDPIPAQLPPSGFDVSRESLAVQLTLKHTTPNGLTLFAPCPMSTKSRNS